MRGVKEGDIAASGLRRLAVAAAMATPLLLTALVGVRLFSMHGSMGLFRASPGVRAAWLGITCLTLLLPLVALLLLRMSDTKRTGGGRRRIVLTVLAWCLVAAASLLPPTVYGEIASYEHRRCGDKPPLILLDERTGEHGIPDLALVFWTEEPTRNVVEWWDEHGRRETLGEDGPSNSHCFFLRDLVPGREYSYRVNADEPRGFTAPPAGEGLRFAVTSDPHYGRAGRDEDAAAGIMRAVSCGPGRADLLFIAGDLVDRGYDDRQWCRALRELAKGAGGIPMRVLPGNHDTMLGGFDLYREYLLPPDGDGGKADPWCRLDRGDVHFLLLDLEWGAEDCTPEQREWLEGQLDSIPPDDWTVVLSHHYLYSSGSVAYGVKRYDDPGMISALTPLFEEKGVDLVISGHNHHMELLEEGGVTYAVVGAMGGKLPPPFSYRSPAGSWSDTGEYGYLLVEVGRDRLELEFRDSEGNVIHAASVGRR